jgi:hypothetical protein
MIDLLAENTWPRSLRRRVDQVRTKADAKSLATLGAAALKEALATDKVDATLAGQITEAVGEQVAVITTIAGDAGVPESPLNPDLRRALAAFLDGVDRANRADLVATLDRAAAILVTAFTVISGALVAAGFAVGDFPRFYRNYFGSALAFLILAGFAILVGTFAFLIDAVESTWKLRLEQAAIYTGVVAFAAAFAIAAWGLAYGSSGRTDRPTLTTALATSMSQAGQNQVTTYDVTARATRSGVQRSDALVTTVWDIRLVAIMCCDMT